jgi:hypothetical protein
MVVGPRLPTWYDINILTGDAECSIASPEVFNVAIYTAVVEASVFDGAGTVANVVARPATLVVVVGVVAESPGLAPLAILSVVDVLPGAAECFVAAPGVVIVAVFAAVVEASATCGVKAVANVVARPATAVVVVGVVVEPPGFCPFAGSSDAVVLSPFVLGGVADGSVGNPVVFNPAGIFPPS